MKKRINVPAELLKRLEIKNVKDNIGHDLMGMYCDIFLDKKKIGYYNDDGWGGETDISLSAESREKILNILNEHNWRSKMFTEGGWDFYDSEDKISEHSQLDCLIEYLHENKLKEKVLKKIEKQSTHEILVGRWDNYSRRSFKGKLPLSTLVKVYGLQKMQDYIDNEVKAKMEEGDEILNTNFEELGLKK